MEDSCDRCRFARPDKSYPHDFVVCRRYPPVVEVGQLVAVFPRTPKGSWCGEYAPIPDYAAEADAIRTRYSGGRLT